MIHHEKCLLCGSTELSSYLKCRDNLVSNKEFELVRCGACGFILTQDAPGEDQMAGYYQAEEYVSHNAGARGVLTLIYRIAREYMLRRKRRYLEKSAGRGKGTILDIGCGTGHFAGHMKKAGWVVTGIEPNEKARHFAASAFGLKVLLPESISDLNDHTFDCITMWHVLEHFHDPFGYASEVSRLLKPDGLWIVAIPDGTSFDALHYRENWAAYDVPRHLWHFTPETLSEFADKAGFSITGSSMLPFDVFYISILSERIKGGSFSFIKGLFKGLWFSFRTLFNKSGSSSLLYTLKPA